MIEFYRNQSSIDTDHLNDVLDGDYHRYRKIMEKILIEDPDFRRVIDDEDDRQMAMTRAMFYLKKMRTAFETKVMPRSIGVVDTRISMQFTEVVFALNMSMSVKYGVSINLIQLTLLTLGTKKHEKYINPMLDNLDEVGCFALTELGHGSNVRGIKTEAHYDKENEEFILNTPDELAMKFWIGGAGKTSTICTVWA